MRLIHNGTSPYARVVRCAILEAGLQDRISIEIMPLRDPASPINDVTPLGTAPVLELDDGTVLTQTWHICSYLDTLHDGRKFMTPAGAPNYWKRRATEGLAEGALNGAAVWAREMRRPENERSPGIIEQERNRAVRWLTVFNSDVYTGFRLDDPGFAHFMFMAAIWVVRMADPDFPYAEKRAGIASWYMNFEDQPSWRATGAG